MDAKEAKEAIKTLGQIKIQYFFELFEHRALTLGVEALEKVPALEVENARLREKETPKEHGPVSWNIDRWSIKCPSCGAEIDDDSEFCKWCGQAIKNDKE